MPGRAASRFEPDLPHNTPFQYRDLAGCLRASHRARLCLRRPSKMLAGRLRHEARAVRTADRSISLMKVRARPKARLEITGCPARHKARAQRGSPRARLTSESCFEYLFGLG